MKCNKRCPQLHENINYSYGFEYTIQNRNNHLIK